MSNENEVTKERTKAETRAQEHTAKEEVVTMSTNTFPFEIDVTGTENVPISARRFEITLGEVPIEELNLDPTNQRLSWRIEVTGTKPTQENLEELMWQDMKYVKPLKHSIAINGGLLEAIIVKSDATVIEGNCRLVCYRKLREGNPEDERWHRIRARVLPPEVSEDDIQVILGELHVAGKNQWVPLEEAEYVYKMITGHWGMRQEDLAKILRKSKSTINNMVKSYKLMREVYLEEYRETNRINDYSYFFEFYKNKRKFPERYHDDNSPDFRNLEEEFIHWVGLDQLNEGIQVRDLPEILTNDRALVSLRKAVKEAEKAKAAGDDVTPGKGYKAAMAILEAEHPEHKVPLYRVMNRMVEELQNAPISEVQKLREGDRGRHRMVSELKSALDGFLEEVGISSENSS